MNYKVTPFIFTSLLKMKCPRCRRGPLFRTSNPFNLRKVFDMYTYCPVCRLRYQLEVGFWYGTGYVSYALAVIISVISLTMYALTGNFSWENRDIIGWLIMNGLLLLVLQPWLMRLSRTLYLYFFVPYDPRTKTFPNNRVPQ